MLHDDEMERKPFTQYVDSHWNPRLSMKYEQNTLKGPSNALDEPIQQIFYLPVTANTGSVRNVSHSRSKSQLLFQA